MKLKCSRIDNLIPLSSCQLDLFFSLVRRSDERYGLVRGVYYKDMLKDVRANRDKKGNKEKDKCCNQTFYNSLKALEKHGIIRVSKQSDLDFDVYICGNEYPEHTQDAFKKEPYINLNNDVFHRNSFKRLKAHEKYLFLYFYQYTFENKGRQTKKVNKKEFYKEMTKKLGVTAPVLRKYLHSLKLFYSIGTLKGNLLVTRLKATNTDSRKEKTEEQWSLEQYITSQCHRLHMKFEQSDIMGLAEYVKNHRKNFKEHGTLVVLSEMMKAMEKSIEGYSSRKRKLNGAYVNKILHPKIIMLNENEKPDMESICHMEKLGLCF